MANVILNQNGMPPLTLQDLLRHNPQLSSVQQTEGGQILIFHVHLNQPAAAPTLAAAAPTPTTTTTTTPVEARLAPSTPPPQVNQPFNVARQFIPTPPPSPLRIAVPPAPFVRKRTWFDRLSLEEMKLLCKAAKARVSGTKKELSDRLQQHALTRRYGDEAISLVQIKEDCRARQLSVSGKKLVLVLRLLEHFSGIMGNNRKRRGNQTNPTTPTRKRASATNPNLREDYAHSNATTNEANRRRPAASMDNTYSRPQQAYLDLIDLTATITQHQDQTQQQEQEDDSVADEAGHGLKPASLENNKYRPQSIYLDMDRQSTYLDMDHQPDVDPEPNYLDVDPQPNYLDLDQQPNYLNMIDLTTTTPTPQRQINSVASFDKRVQQNRANVMPTRSTARETIDGRRPNIQQRSPASTSRGNMEERRPNMQQRSTASTARGTTEEWRPNIQQRPPASTARGTTEEWRPNIQQRSTASTARGTTEERRPNIQQRSTASTARGMTEEQPNIRQRSTSTTTQPIHCPTRRKSTFTPHSLPRQPSESRTRARVPLVGNNKRNVSQMSQHRLATATTNPANSTTIVPPSKRCRGRQQPQQQGRHATPECLYERMETKIYAMAHQKKYQSSYGSKNQFPDVWDAIHTLLQKECYQTGLIRSDPCRALDLAKGVFTALRDHFDTMGHPEYGGWEFRRTLQDSLRPIVLAADPQLSPERAKSTAQWMIHLHTCIEGYGLEYGMDKADTLYGMAMTLHDHDDDLLKFAEEGHRKFGKKLTSVP